LHGGANLQDATASSHPAAEKGSTLWFPAGVGGLLVKYINDSDASGLAATYKGGTNAVIERLRLQCAGDRAVAAGKYGIESRAGIVLRDVIVRGFGDHGIYIRASLSGSDGVAFGNANKSVLQNVQAVRNAGDGFRLAGNDANCISLVSCIGLDNGGWAFFDDGLITNTYVGCLSEGDDAGAFKTVRATPHIFIGCHSEGGLCEMDGACTVIGGTVGQSSLHAPTSTAFVMDNGLAVRQGYRHRNVKGATVIGSQMGTTDPDMAAFAWGRDDNQAYRDYKFVYNPRGGGGYWGPQYAGSGATVGYQLPDGVTNSGRGFAIEFPRGICIGDLLGNQNKLWSLGGAAPTSGSWSAGDVVWNNAAAANDALGWRCTASGSPGTWEAIVAGSGRCSFTSSAGIAAGANFAQFGYNSTYGAFTIGGGSSFDYFLFNSALGNVMSVAAGSTTARFWGQVQVGGTIVFDNAGALQAAALPNGTVTYAKIQNVAASRLLGNAGGTAGAPAEIGLGAGLAFTGGNLAVAGALSPTSLAAAGAVTSSSATAGMGYASGAGGTVTQATSKSTGVTLNKVCGQVTLNAAALAASTTVTFVLTNSAIAAGDILILNHVSGGTAGSYALNAQCGAGTASINVRNISGASLSEAIVVGFALHKATTA
jgi:hypothetical protein